LSIDKKSRRLFSWERDFVEVDAESPNLACRRSNRICLAFLQGLLEIGAAAGK